jgi:hypothetical protein
VGSGQQTCALRRLIVISSYLVGRLNTIKRHLSTFHLLCEHDIYSLTFPAPEFKIFSPRFQNLTYAYVLKSVLDVQNAFMIKSNGRLVNLTRTNQMGTTEHTAYLDGTARHLLTRSCITLSHSSLPVRSARLVFTWGHGRTVLLILPMLLAYIPQR